MSLEPTRLPHAHTSVEGSVEHWSAQGLELDRTLDGELEATILEDRRREAQRVPEVAQRLAARARFHSALNRAAEAHRAALTAAMPAGLESRIRFALVADAHARRDQVSRSRLRWAVAAAAVLLVGLASALFRDNGGGAEAMPPEVMKAAAAALSPGDGPRGCQEATISPMQFPLVKDGSLKIWRCVNDGRGTVAKLYRPEDLPSLGYVAVAQGPEAKGPEIGMTDLGEVVVYDLAYGKRHHYLAVSRAFLDHQRALTPGRESCRACHNRSRVGQDNPHNIVHRSWRMRR